MTDGLDQIVGLLPLLVASGLFAGLLAGLLGIGGGIVMTPVLFLVFSTADVPEAWRMHMALATSLAIIVPTGLSSARAHYRHDAVDVALVRRWLVPVALGALAGAAIAAQVDSRSLVAFFVVVAVLMGIKMILPLEGRRIGDALPTGPAGFAAPTLIGMFGALMGIGGATFSVPYMTLFGMAIHRAVGTAALLGLAIAVTAGIGYVVGGLGVEGLPPWTLGFVSLPALVVVAPLSALAAPWGAKLAHKLSRRWLSAIFGLFLIISAARLAMAL